MILVSTVVSLVDHTHIALSKKGSLAAHRLASFDLPSMQHELELYRCFTVAGATNFALRQSYPSSKVSEQSQIWPSKEQERSCPNTQTVSLVCLSMVSLHYALWYVFHPQQSSIVEQSVQTCAFAHSLDAVSPVCLLIRSHVQSRRQGCGLYRWLDREWDHWSFISPVCCRRCQLDWSPSMCESWKQLPMHRSLSDCCTARW